MHKSRKLRWRRTERIEYEYEDEDEEEAEEEVEETHDIYLSTHTQTHKYHVYLSVYV